MFHSRLSPFALLPAIVVALLLTGLPTGASAVSSEAPKVREELQSAFDRSVAAWNRGDLDAFLAIYSADATLVSATGLTKGRAALLEHYRSQCPTREAMGTLSFNILETRTVEWGWKRGKAYSASVIGEWSIAAADGTSTSGHALLVLQREGQLWQVVQDASL